MRAKNPEELSDHASLTPGLFRPIGGHDRFFVVNLRTQYPVLGEDEHIRPLNNNELMFVYKYSCPTAPYVEAGYPDDTRAKLCAEECFRNAAGKLHHSMTEEDYQSYIDMYFPDRVKLAIERMRKFDPAIRYKAQVSIDKSIDSMYKASQYLNKKLSDVLSGEVDMDIDDVKRIIDMITKSSSEISDSMPKLIALKEKGFGFKVDKDDFQGSYLDQAMLVLKQQSEGIR